MDEETEFVKAKSSTQLEKTCGKHTTIGEERTMQNRPKYGIQQ